MTAQQTAERFRHDGFVSRIRVHDPIGADRVREQFDALEAAEGRERCQIGLVDGHLDQRFVWELATHPVLLDTLETVLGPDIMVLFSHFFCKYPTASPAASPLGSERFVAWHQDVTYWGLEPAHAVTAWYAVDASGVENGCMRVIPGSHRGGLRPHGTAARPGNLLSINQEVPVTPGEEAEAVDLVLDAGEASLHDGLLIHGSDPNRSERRRCGLTVRYVPPSVKPVGTNSLGRVWAGILVRGRDKFHHYGDREPPFE